MVKKKMVKKKVKKPASVSKSDFEVFARGVERLKELGAELDGLDTRGFSKDAQAIRARLKTVSEIPSIEMDLKKLRAKIDNKFKPKKKRSSPKRNKDIGEIKDGLPKIERRIRELGSKVERMNSKKRKVDSGVGELVEVGFDNFLNDLKSGVSERVKMKEKQVAFSLKKDLVEHERVFRKKHSEMVKDFHMKRRGLEKDYHGKMSSGREKLMVEFRKKVEDNKKKVAAGLKKMSDDEKRFKKNKEAEISKIKEDLRKSKVAFEKHKSSDVAKRRKDFLEKKKGLEKKKIELGKKREMLEKKRVVDTKALEKKRVDSVKKIDRDMKVEVARRRAEFAKIKAGLEKGRIALEKKRVSDTKILEGNMKVELEKQKVAMSNKYQKMFRSFFQQKSMKVLKNDKDKLRRKFTEAGVKERIRLKMAFHDKMEREVAAKVDNIKIIMKNEFEANLKKKVAAHDEVLKRKIRAHDLEIKNKMAEHDKQLEKDRKNLQVEIKRKMARILG
jgi:hypothetical protein